MKITVTLSMFRDMMNDSCPGAFSYEGLEVLFNFLESLEYEKEQEFDPEEINGNYSEVKLKYVAKDAHLTYEEYVEINIDEDEYEDELVTYDWETMNDEQLREVVEEYLERETCILGFTKDTVVYMDF